MRMLNTPLFLKHFLDRLIALLLAIVLAPVLMLMAIAVKLENGGPVFSASHVSASMRVSCDNGQETMVKSK